MLPSVLGVLLPRPGGAIVRLLCGTIKVENTWALCPPGGPGLVFEVSDFYHRRRGVWVDKR